MRPASGTLVAIGCLLSATIIRAADLAVALEDPTAIPTAIPVAATDAVPDPLAGTPRIDPATTGPDAETILASMLPPRSDSAADWYAPLEPLHYCGEPRRLRPCVPPPPCHPALPPQPYDLVGVHGSPTCGPIYGGPCAPRTGSHDGSRLPRLHRVPDRLFDWFYRSR
ncbi:MAG: hypothetical protein ACKOSQ_00655 [Planctomycetaceae bacterium]